MACAGTCPGQRRHNGLAHRRGLFVPSRDIGCLTNTYTRVLGMQLVTILNKAFLVMLASIILGKITNIEQDLDHSVFREEYEPIRTSNDSRNT